MDRLNLSSQRVNVNRDNDYVQTYYIRKKTSVRKSRLTEEMVKDLVTQAIQEYMTESASVDDFMLARQDIAVAIVKHINSLPTTQTMRLSLDRGTMKRKRDGEEQEEKE
jgi:TATA-binding protein-associated factor Taf7